MLTLLGAGQGQNGSYVDFLIAQLKTRVALDGGTFEAESCLKTTLTNLKNAQVLEQASLVITPNDVKAGKLYSVIPTNGAGDLDVVRATSATRVNEQGLVEIPRTNLLLRSEEFDNASWAKTALTVTANATTSPNGTMTANLLSSSSTTGFISQVTNNIIGTTYTFSIYIKNIDAISTAFLGRVSSNNYSFGINWSGSVISSITNIVGNTTFQLINNGWYRITCVFNSLESSILHRIYADNTIINKSVFIWGAQLEAGNVATEYIPTTSVIRTRFAGITQDGGSASNIPRIDYTNGSCPSILVEPQRTNLLLRSEEFDNDYWTKSAVTISANSTTSPDGTNNADKFIPSVDNSTHQILQIGFTSSAYTFSVYAKAGEETTFSLWLRSASVFARFDLSNGTITHKSASVVATITNVGNGWFRCTAYDPTPGTTVQIYGRNGSAFIGNGTDGFYIWGAQLEAGSNATSYIPTVASAVTRNADVISKSGISSLIGQTEGTIYFDGIVNNIQNDFSNILNTDKNLSLSTITLGKMKSDNKFSFTQMLGNGSSGSAIKLTSTNAFANGIRTKIAIRYKSGSFAMYINGNLESTSSSSFTNIGTKSELFLNDSVTFFNYQESVSFNSVVLFTSGLTNTELAQLTTL